LQLLSTREPLREAGLSDSPATSAVLRRQPEEAGEASAQALTTPLRGSRATRLSTKHWTRQAALLVFCDPLPDQCLRLLQLSSREWERLLRWLDISGLALYFLDRMAELKLRDKLPPNVVERLQQNLADNTWRTCSMIAESIAIQQEFQAARLSYAVVKGFSLCPHSVPKPELRHQFDLDFLVAEQSALEARQILENKGYRLEAISDRSWEFKINESPGFSLDNLYKDLPCRSVELHIEASAPGSPMLLERVERREFHGISMPVLSPVDLLLGQGLHAYKHVCSESSRTAHLLEFRRHVLAWRNNEAFWHELRATASNNPRAFLSLGLVTLLTASAMDDFAPEALTSWTVARLPASVRLWVEIYGSRSVFESFPGSKLYLLLQKELAFEGVPPKRSLGQALLPRRLPPPVTRASANESLHARFRRYGVQLRLIRFRLCFHIVEGIRYALESRRWRQRLNRLAQR
jgi:hypothetical protein